VLLFQVVRELLFNINKHAGVDRATVQLTEAAGHLVIHVIDEGSGFEVEATSGQTEPQAGFGLYSIRERLGLLGGHLVIQSQPGQGTHVEVHIPVPPLSPPSGLRATPERRSD
jgi:signal transduction histidine kinase